MDYQNIGKGPGGPRRACVLWGGTLIAATAICLSVTGTAHAAAAPTANLSFSSATISAGTQPQMTFLSSNVPSGSVLYLEESADGGRQWKTVDKTTDTQGTSLLGALSGGHLRVQDRHHRQHRDDRRVRACHGHRDRRGRPAADDRHVGCSPPPRRPRARLPRRPARACRG